MATLEQLGLEVANNTSVINSAITLIDGIAAKLEELKNDPAQIQSYADELRASSDRLAAQVIEHTEVQPPPEEPPV